ncbi:unnamed protein product [Merluccius merluccius]
MSCIFRLLVVAGACLCVCGTPVYLTHRQSSLDPPQEGASVAMSGSGALVRVTDPSEDEGSAGGGGGGGGGDGPDARRARPGETRSRGNGDITGGGRSGPGPDGGGKAARGRERREAEAEEEAQTSESPAETADDGSRPTPDAALSADQERGTPVASATEGNATATAATGAPPQADPQRSAAWEKEAAPGGPPSRGPPGASAGGQSPQILGTVSSASAPSPGASPFPALSEWGGQDGATAPFVPDLLLAEVGPDAMPKPEAPEGLWSEAARESEVDTEVPLSQDQSTEGTMSSEALPLIFDPFDDVTPQGAATAAAAAGVTGAAAPGGPQPPIAAKATVGTFPSEAAFDRLVTVETDGDGPSHPPPMLMPEWTSPWQTSGTELEPSTSPDPAAPPPPGPSERQTMKDSDKVAKLEGASSVSVLPASSLLSSGKPVTEATHRHVSKSTSGLEEMESEEEPDEDEEDENTEESDEDDEEDEEQTETPASTRPPYSLIPPPPVWVQHNQGLMRSWMELIREKAGYVSGMLAPVGIGIAGAILIVGALYSIRMIHRRRRNSFKYQRRKVRQQEQPREIGPSRPDQAMLLADSSEDEF